MYCVINDRSEISSRNLVNIGLLPRSAAVLSENFSSGSNLSVKSMANALKVEGLPSDGLRLTHEAQGDGVGVTDRGRSTGRKVVLVALEAEHAVLAK